MSEQITEPILTEKALAFAAGHFDVTPGELTVSEVSGGYSLNRRAIVGYGDQHIFVKEVDISILEGNGDRERHWLAKDHGLTEHLRGEKMHMVTEWSKLSDDSEVLLLPALLSEDGWLWELPVEPQLQRRYIEAVVRVINELEHATFTPEEVERLWLQPYFREEVAADDSLKFLASADNEQKLHARYTELHEKYQDEFHEMMVKGAEALINDKEQVARIQKAVQRLNAQQNNAFGHCDIRVDNIAYHPETDRVVLVDWNWASQTPKKFGTTEFLISVAVRGVDINEWHEELNPELLAGLMGFWWRRSILPNLGSSNRLRTGQALSAAVALDLFKKVGQSYL